MKKFLAILTVLISMCSGYSFEINDSLNFENCISITAPAVSITDEGYVGAPIQIDIKVSEGEGHTYMDTMPLTDLDMQGSARIASKVAFDICGKEKDDYDVYYIIRSDVPTVGGPSAGAVLTVATIAAVNGWTINKNVMMTGMIGPDGTIGPVGGILEKIEVGNEAGIDYFLIPYGQRDQTDKNNNSVDAVEYGKSLGITVIEVSNIYDAVYYLTNHKISEYYETDPVLKERYSKIMEELSKTTLERAKTELENIEKLDLESLNSTEKEEFEDGIKNAANLIYVSNELHSNEDYYASTSRSFNSLIIMESLNSKYLYKDNDSVKNYILSVNESINSKKQFLKDAKLTKNNVEYVFAAKSRVYEASELLEESEISYNEGDLDSAIYYASYAKLRAETGIWWLNLAPETDDSEEIDETELKYLAREYLDNSEIVVIYSSTILPESLISYSMEQVDDSIDYYNDKEYLLSMSKSIDAYVYSTTVLDYSTDIDYLKNLAQKKINKVESCGNGENNVNIDYVPVSALGYFEYAENLDDQYSKVLYFKYSIAYAQMNIDVLNEFENERENEEEITECSVSEGTENGSFNIDYKNSFINMVYLITGLISGILIKSWYSKND